MRIKREVRATDLTLRNRFHPVYSLAILRKPAILCVVPLITALAHFDLNGLLTALWQELALISMLLVLGVVFWRGAGWQLQSGRLTFRRSIFGLQWQERFSADDLAFVAVRRCWYLRPIGAVRLEFSTERGITRHLYLTRTAADALADRLLPAEPALHDLTPSAGDRLVLALLNCDLFATLVLLAASLRNTSEFMGRTWTQHLTQTGLHTLESLLGHWLPLGLSGLASVLLVLTSLTLLLAFSRTSRYQVLLEHSTIRCTGGALSPTCWVLRRSCITCADLRRTPMARLLKRYPLFLSVGGYTGNAVLLCSGLQDPTLEKLFPESEFPQPGPGPGKRRSLVPFCWMPALWLAVCAALFAASLLLPGLLPYAGRILWLPACIGLVWLFVGFEGWRGDRLAQSPNLFPAACSTRFFTHHHYCLLRCPVALRWQNPLSRRAARCELRLCLPGRRAIAVHNLRLADCDALFFSSQKEEP